MVSQANLEYLRAGGRRYIVGTPKSQLRRFEQELLEADWQQVREGLEVKVCPSPDGQESFILCRSAERAAKENAIHDRFEKRIEKGLTKLADSCRKKKQKPGAIERRVGRILAGNSRAAGLFRVEVVERVGGGGFTFRFAGDQLVAELLMQRGENKQVLKSRHDPSLDTVNRQVLKHTIFGPPDRCFEPVVGGTGLEPVTSCV